MNTYHRTMLALLAIIAFLATVLWLATEVQLRAHRCPETAEVPPIKAMQAEVVYEIAEQEDAGTILALGEMTVTIYHAVPSQTDDTPMITASGFNLTGLDLEAERICALSRDLLARWGGPIDYGDQIYVDVPDPALRGWWTVEDTMAPRWRNHIALLVPTSRKGGKWEGVEAWMVTL